MNETGANPQVNPRPEIEEILDMLQKLQAQSEKRYIITTYTALTTETPKGA